MRRIAAIEKIQVSATVGLLAQHPTHTIGHNLPVRITFQFLLVVRPVN